MSLYINFYIPVYNCEFIRRWLVLNAVSKLLQNIIISQYIFKYDVYVI